MNNPLSEIHELLDRADYDTREFLSDLLNQLVIHCIQIGVNDNHDAHLDAVKDITVQLRDTGLIID